MRDEDNFSNGITLLSCKTVIRTKDFKSSKRFYTQLLNLPIIEEYNDGNGSRGIIVRIGEEGSNALLEVSEIKESHIYYQAQFSENFNSNKSSIQIRTDDVFKWAAVLNKEWKTKGPILRPWGSHYLYLRDPDELQIIIYQEKSNKK